MKRTDTKTLIEAARILSRDIQSDDGVANAALAEIADRLEELDGIRLRLTASLESTFKSIEKAQDLNEQAISLLSK